MSLVTECNADVLERAAGDDARLGYFAWVVAVPATATEMTPP